MAAGAGENGVEQALAAQQLVLHAGNLPDLHLHPGGEARHVAGVHHDLLTRLEVVLHQRAVDLGKSHAAAAEALHDEALAAEEACAQPLVEVDGQLYSRHGGQKGTLLEDHIVAGSDGDLLDLAGEAGAEGDHPGAVSGVDVLEHTLAGEHFREHPPQSTAMGLHLHIRAHPDHGATLRDHLLAVFQLTDYHGEGSAFDFITHGGILLTIFRQRRGEPPPCVSWYGSSIAEKRNERKKKIYPKPYILQEAAQDSVVSGSLRRVLPMQRKYTRCSVCRADSVLHFAGILGSGATKFSPLR